jgi:hypothetical protein
VVYEKKLLNKKKYFPGPDRGRSKFKTLLYIFEKFIKNSIKIKKNICFAKFIVFV